MRWKVAAIVVLLVVAGVAVGASLGLFRPATTTATSLLTATAAQADVTDEVTATGAVAASATYALAFGAEPVTTPAGAASSSSSSSGSNASSSSNGSNGSGGGASVTWPVTEVDVKVGDRVTAGQTLAKASTTDLEAQISDANLGDKSAKLQADQAQTNLDDASGTAQVRQAKIGLYNAQANASKALATLKNLEALRKLATLTAPADGVVTAVSIATGADAPSGTAIALSAASLEVSTDVVESDIAKIAVGQSATITVTAIDATLQGTVTTIAPSGSSSGNNGVVEYAVEIALDAPPAALRPGMSADISIVTASASGVLAIPSRALSGSPGSYTVRVVDPDGTVETRDVTVGLVTSALAEIQSGLQAGERVVTGTSSAQGATGGVNGRLGGLGGAVFGGGGGGGGGAGANGGGAGGAGVGR